MMRASRSLAGAVLGLAVASCGWQLVPTKPREVAKGYWVDPQIEWSGRKFGGSELWTVHGLALERVQLTRAVEDGDPLLEPGTGSDELPLFRSAMSASEVVELVVQTLSRVGAAHAEALDLRPREFARRSGFEFDLRFASASGLEMTGRAAGAVVDGKLYLILFTAPRVHYYDLYADEVERVMDSARFE